MRVCTDAEQRMMLPYGPNGWLYRGRLIMLRDGTFFAQIGADKWSQHPCVPDAQASIDDTLAAYEDSPEGKGE